MAAAFDAPRVPPPSPRCSPTAVLPVVHPPRTGYKSLEYLSGYSRCPITASARRGRLHPDYSRRDERGCNGHAALSVFRPVCIRTTVYLSLPFFLPRPNSPPRFPPMSFVINAKHRSFGLLPVSRATSAIPRFFVLSRLHTTQKNTPSAM